jgi:hypothetical protein
VQIPLVPQPGKAIASLPKKKKMPVRFGNHAPKKLPLPSLSKRA